MRRVGRRLAASACGLVLCAAAAAQPLSFAVLADTHIGSGAAASSGLAALVQAINADSAIRFVIVAGDVTEKGRDAELEEAKALLGRLKAPCHVLPGNHDTHWAGFGGYGFQRAFGGDRLDFEMGGAFFLGLSAWDQGHFAPDDIVWLEERIRRIPADADVFFFVHFPPSSIDNWPRVHAALRTRRSVVIAGHVHADSQGYDRGLPFWTVRAALARDGRPPSLAIVTLDRSTVEIAHSEPSGSSRLWGAFSRRGRAPVPALAPVPLLPARAELLWLRQLGRRLGAGPVSDGKRLFAADFGGRVTCWSRTGKVLWTYQAQAPFISRPAVQGRFLLAASADGRVVKLSASRGGLFSAADLGLRPTSPLTPFEANPGRIPRFWLGTSSGRLLGLNSFNLTPWLAIDAAKGPIQSAPLAVGGRLVFGAWDGSAHAADAATGRELWRWTENDNFYYSPAGCAPASDGRRAFFCAPDGFVSAVDLATGQTAWRVQAGAWESLGLSEDGRRVLVKSRLDEILVLDAADGRLRRRIAPAHGAGELEPGAPLEWKGRILLGARTGRVLSIDEAGRVEVLLDLGPGGVHTLVPMGGGRFAAANVDGAVAVFRLRD